MTDLSGREIFLLTYAVAGWLLAWFFACVIERERTARRSSSEGR